MSARAAGRGAGRPPERSPDGRDAGRSGTGADGEPPADHAVTHRREPPTHHRALVEPDLLDVRRWPTGRLLSAAARRVEQRWNEALAEWDLTHAGLGVLASLVASPLTQRDIAQRVLVEDQTMSRTLDRLERAGHVTRHADPGDRRRRIVTLTDSGRTAVESVLRSRVAESLVDDVVPDRQGFRDALVSVLENAGDREPAERSTTAVPAARTAAGGAQ